MEERNWKIRRNILILAFAILIGAVALAVWLGFRGEENIHTFNYLMAGGLALFWILTDVVSPLMTKEREGKSEEEKRTMNLMALLNLAGYAGLGYFVIARDSNTGIYGAVVFVLTSLYKRKLREQPREEEAPDGEEQTVDESGEAGVPGVSSEDRKGQTGETPASAAQVAEDAEDDRNGSV